jgi:hypothetical protein
METPTAINPTRKPPSPRDVDALVECFEEVRDKAELADEDFENAKLELIELVKQFGSVPPKAESSVRLEGALTFATITTRSTMTLKDDEVSTLKGAMSANGHEAIFEKMFTERTKYQLQKGATIKLRAAKLNKRLTEKYTKLYALCFDVKKNSPSLTVERFENVQPKRGKKGGR